MEVPKYHEIVRPLKEIVVGLGEFVINRVVPEGTFDDFLAGGPLDERPVETTQPTLWD